MSCCTIWETFDENNNIIKEYLHWKLLLRNRNTTLGNCVAITKRHIERFSDIRSEEMEDFSHVVKDVEHALKKSFNYDKINYLMLMMKDDHTHFHIIPRYSSQRKFSGLIWYDEEWPKPTIIQKDLLDSKILAEIKTKIKANI